jgi:hypothetical protein
VEMSAVGSGRDVPKANLLMVKAEGTFQLRITQDDGLGGSVVSTIQCGSLFILETPDTLAVTLVEIASSTRVEYFASGA